MRNGKKKQLTAILTFIAYQVDDAHTLCLNNTVLKRSGAAVAFYHPLLKFFVQFPEVD